jgi:hypothetical protein
MQLHGHVMAFVTFVACDLSKVTRRIYGCTCWPWQKTSWYPSHKLALFHAMHVHIRIYETHKHGTQWSQKHIKAYAHMQHKKYNIHYHFIDMVKGWKRHQLNEVTCVHLYFNLKDLKNIFCHNLFFKKTLLNFFYKIFLERKF